ncbi:MAG: hypothetical protein LBC87_07335 [Fibromonadaceae bacterium]|jgi:hypothetical protein|nr:hypothetical protein [Fibromonadaceae bacterium]
MNIANLLQDLVKLVGIEAPLKVKRNFKVFIRTPTETEAEYKFWDIECVEFDDDNGHINLFAKEVQNAKRR